MATYTFKTVSNGYPKLKSSGGYHVPKEKPTIDENSDNVVITAGRVEYTIYPATDTVVIDATTNAPGTFTVSSLSDALNVLFPKGNSSSAGSGTSYFTAAEIQFLKDFVASNTTA